MENGIPVGVVLIDVDGDTAFIDNLYVLPDGRGKGYGRRLLQEAIAHLRQLKVRKVDLMVTADNEIAVHLYDEAGFDISRLRMTKFLDPAYNP